MRVEHVSPAAETAGEPPFVDRHVYEPHRAALPPLGQYMRDLWQRRHFALELARSDLASLSTNMVLGKVWLLLNPLLLALAYFVLVTIVRGGSRGPEFLAHLMLGLFAFRFVRSSIKQGARSVVGGSRLILNIAFPRTLLTLATVMTAFMRFLPTLAVYAVMHGIAGLPVGPHLLWVVPLLALLFVFALGAALLVATVQVYFRDLTSFLRYVLRIWLFATPILYYAEDVPARYKPILLVNPLYPLVTSLSDVTNAGQNPSGPLLAAATAWSFAALVAGGLFFVSREKEFAVRL